MSEAEQQDNKKENKENTQKKELDGNQRRDVETNAEAPFADGTPFAEGGSPAKGVSPDNHVRVDASLEELVDPQTQLDAQTQTAVLEAAVAEANDRALRAQAELENFRKRVYRQMDEERKYAAQPLVRDLLPVIDNLQRAIDHAVQDENSSSLLEGVKMVAQQFNAVLEQHHCKKIDAKGETFDPHLHEALAQQPSDEYPAGCVVDVAQVGYQLHDRVVRPSQVFVSAGTPESTPKQDTNDTAEGGRTEG